MPAVDVKSLTPNEIPDIVTLVRPEPAPFQNGPDTVGASNVTETSPVPRAASIVKTTSVPVANSKIGAYGAAVHLTAVAVLQDVVRQSLVARATDTVNASWPKFRPEIVTMVPPVSGLFGKACDTTGASKLNPGRTRVVPTNAATVTLLLRSSASVQSEQDGTTDPHMTDVAELQVVLPHAASPPIAAVEV